MRHLLFSVFFLLLVVFAGCSGNVKVGGTVTFEDGSPLECGTIAFTNGANQARSDIGKDGKYVLGTLTDKDGIAQGEYIVYITGAETVTPNPKNETTSFYTPLVDPKFTSDKTSPLKIKIDKEQTYDVKIEKAKGKDAAPQERSNGFATPIPL
jgi:hypothetical protein